MATTPQSFLKFVYKKLKIKKLGAIWKILDTVSQIEKNWNFGGWITKIETLVFKYAVNFDGVNYNFSNV